ncbi:MAG: hypothetical protein HKM07_07700 [Chlamydiae bacterium]|nr:hypothetical protein [Chlamydiota bacterium]
MRSFEKLLQEIGSIINIPMHAEEGRICLLEINHNLRIQIEDDLVKQKIVVVCFIAEIAAGKFRENILKEALKANFFSSRIGNFAYLEKNNSLSFYTYVENTISAEEISLVLERCITVGNNWYEAIRNSQIPNITQESSQFF